MVASTVRVTSAALVISGIIDDCACLILLEVLGEGKGGKLLYLSHQGL